MISYSMPFTFGVRNINKKNKRCEIDEICVAEGYKEKREMGQRERPVQASSNRNHPEIFIEIVCLFLSLVMT